MSLNEFVKSQSKNGRNTITTRDNKYILTIGKNKYGGCYLLKYDTEKRDSEFVDLNHYYEVPNETPKTYNHSLSAALCAAELVKYPESKVVDTHRKLRASNNIKTYEDFNKYLNNL